MRRYLYRSWCLWMCMELLGGVFTGVYFYDAYRLFIGMAVEEHHH
jgi:hypothetical protein